VPWTAEQYVRRVLVRVARDTGRPVPEIGGQSFALTLWTWAELEDMAREDQVARMGERTDLAGQVAVAFHQPQDMLKLEHRYLKAAGQLTPMIDAARERLTRIAEDAAKAQPVPE
jgi:hypothetical protein